MYLPAGTSIQFMPTTLNAISTRSAEQNMSAYFGVNHEAQRVRYIALIRADHALEQVTERALPPFKDACWQDSVSFDCMYNKSKLRLISNPG